MKKLGEQKPKSNIISQNVTMHLFGACLSTAHEDHMDVATEPDPFKRWGYQLMVPIVKQGALASKYPYIPYFYF